MANNSKTMYLCMHVLQVAPVSCINRDDTGTPKTCIYGGTSRMRVSSQCWKRAVRMYLKDKYGDTGVRTKFIIKTLADKLTDSGICDKETASEFVKKWIGKAHIVSDDEGKKETSAFFSLEQINALSCLLNEYYSLEKERNETEEDTEEAKKEKVKRENAFCKKLVDAVMDSPSASELLFGRMFASNPKLNYDAACQVAHAFSVNEVYEEPDYFTVVGDIKREEILSGSDYLDTKLFNSGILYRFADVNLSEGSELRNEQYKVDAAKVCSNFIEAFVLSMPSGSANAYANMTLPEMVLIELRDDIPVSFAPAFVKAVDGKDICRTAMDTMVEYEEKVSRIYGEPIKKWVLGDVTLKELCLQVEDEINRRL